MSIRSISRRTSYLIDLAGQLILRDIRLRYKRSILGIGWSILNPLLQFLVFYGVFRWIIPVNVPDFAVFLFIGILCWNWFQASLTSGCVAIVDNASLIRQPGFPAPMLPFVTVGTHLVNFVLSLPVLAAALLITGHGFTSAVAVLPVVIAIQFLLTLSVVYILSVLHVSFRDTQYLLGVILLLGMYVSPIFYSIEAVPPNWRSWYSLNPLVHLLGAYRTVLIRGAYPDWLPLALTGIVSGIVLAISYTLFVHRTHSFVEEIGS